MKPTYQKRIDAGLCMYCGNVPPKQGKRWCDECCKKNTKKNLRWRSNNRDAFSVIHKKSKFKLRKEVIDHYGGKCECCGESEITFLTLDHKNNDGANHRKEPGVPSGQHFYDWVKKNNFPDFLQILCWNCNSAKRFGHICPHQLKLSSQKQEMD